MPADENDEDVYPAIKVVRGGELPEGARESDHEDEQAYAGKNKKHDPHRALNIDLDEKPIVKVPSPPAPAPPSPAAEPVEKSATAAAAATTEKPKKKKTKEEKAAGSKGKGKRERSGYKELGSPADEEEKEQRVASPPVAPVAVPTTAATTTEEKPKKKKTKDKKSTKESAAAEAAPALLFDIMSDDINPIGTSNSQINDEHVYKPLTQSDHLAIVRSPLRLSRHWTVF